ncbi:hypothetical protein PVAG01_03334 [Phlyctema vagabunda]|uniref:Uncharacterized protein n=1 Tax=Phlyctema vagabunda TaxID=108571 RepID=A0ABR4PL42_9HELO
MSSPTGDMPEETSPLRLALTSRATTPDPDVSPPDSPHDPDEGDPEISPQVSLPRTPPPRTPPSGADPSDPVSPIKHPEISVVIDSPTSPPRGNPFQLATDTQKYPIGSHHLLKPGPRLVDRQLERLNRETRECTGGPSSPNGVCYDGDADRLGMFYVFGKGPLYIYELPPGCIYEATELVRKLSPTKEQELKGQWYQTYSVWTDDARGLFENSDTSSHPGNFFWPRLSDERYPVFPNEEPLSAISEPTSAFSDDSDDEESEESDSEGSDKESGGEREDDDKDDRNFSDLMKGNSDDSSSSGSDKDPRLVRPPGSPSDSLRRREVPIRKETPESESDDEVSADSPFDNIEYDSKSGYLSHNETADSETDNKVRPKTPPQTVKLAQKGLSPIQEEDEEQMSALTKNIARLKGSNVRFLINQNSKTASNPQSPTTSSEISDRVPSEQEVNKAKEEYLSILGYKSINPDDWVAHEELEEYLIAKKSEFEALQNRRKAYEDRQFYQSSATSSDSGEVEEVTAEQVEEANATYLELLSRKIKANHGHSAWTDDDQDALDDTAVKLEALTEALNKQRDLDVAAAEANQSPSDLGPISDGTDPQSANTPPSLPRNTQPEQMSIEVPNDEYGGSSERTPSRVRFDLLDGQSGYPEEKDIPGDLQRERPAAPAVHGEGDEDGTRGRALTKNERLSESQKQDLGRYLATLRRDCASLQQQVKAKFPNELLPVRRTKEMNDPRSLKTQEMIYHSLVEILKILSSVERVERVRWKMQNLPRLMTPRYLEEDEIRSVREVVRNKRRSTENHEWSDEDDRKLDEEFTAYRYFLRFRPSIERETTPPRGVDLIHGPSFLYDPKTPQGPQSPSVLVPPRVGGVRPLVAPQLQQPLKMRASGGPTSRQQSDSDNDSSPSSDEDSFPSGPSLPTRKAHRRRTKKAVKKAKEKRLRDEQTAARRQIEGRQASNPLDKGQTSKQGDENNKTLPVDNDKTSSDKAEYNSQSNGASTNKDHGSAPKIKTRNVPSFPGSSSSSSSSSNASCPNSGESSEYENSEDMATDVISDIFSPIGSPTYLNAAVPEREVRLTGQGSSDVNLSRADLRARDTYSMLQKHETALKSPGSMWDTGLSLQLHTAIPSLLDRKMGSKAVERLNHKIQNDLLLLKGEEKENFIKRWEGLNERARDKGLALIMVKGKYLVTAENANIEFEKAKKEADDSQKDSARNLEAIDKCEDEKKKQELRDEMVQSLVDVEERIRKHQEEGEKQKALAAQLKPEVDAAELASTKANLFVEKMANNTGLSEETEFHLFKSRISQLQRFLVLEEWTVAHERLAELKHKVDEFADTPTGDQMLGLFCFWRGLVRWRTLGRPEFPESTFTAAWQDFIQTDRLIEGYREADYALTYAQLCVTQQGPPENAVLAWESSDESLSDYEGGAGSSIDQESLDQQRKQESEQE